MNGYITIGDAALKWDISERRIQRLCSEGRVSGAAKLGRAWVIPATAEKPEDKRTKKWKKYASYPSESRIKEAVYGNDVHVLSDTDTNSVLYKKNEEGAAVINHYRVYPGIDVYYNDIHMRETFVSDEHPVPHILEINHCREGRFEGELYSGEYVTLSPGDLSINLISNKCKRSETLFPLARYYGISIVIDLPVAGKVIRRLSSSLGGLPIDLDEIRRKTQVDRGVFIIRAAHAVEAIFSELYKISSHIREDFLKLKLLELFLFLSATDISSRGLRKSELKGKHIETVKEIKKYLTANMGSHISLDTLTEVFNIPLTTMKSRFKAYFGTPISTYMREYRLQEAAKLLRETDLSISEIAESMGYENPAKFSTAFRKLMKYSPSVFRENSRPSG